MMALYIIVNSIVMLLGLVQVLWNVQETGVNLDEGDARLVYHEFDY